MGKWQVRFWLKPVITEQPPLLQNAMPNLSNPTDIARKTLDLLAQRRIAPTPDNYRQLYHELAGARAPLELAADLALQKGRAEEGGEEDWVTLIGDLLKQWETAHSGITLRRKREGVERVLANFGQDPAVLCVKLRALVDAWMDTPVRQDILAEDRQAAGQPPAPLDVPLPEMRGAAPGAESGGPDIPAQLRELLGQCLEFGVAPRLSQYPDLLDEATGLAERARGAGDVLALRRLAKDLKQFWFKLAIRGEGDAAVQAGLLRLLRLLIDNISELVTDDQWLKGQVAVIRDVISQPVTSRDLYYAERSFKDLILQQGVLKHGLTEAKATLKQMIASFIGRLGEMSESTGEYHAKITRHADKIGQTEDIGQLNQILQELQADTKSVQLDMLRSREELLDARRRVEEAEERVRQLQTELEQVSELVREDQLTGALNRRGLEDEFDREIARSDRVHSPFSIAVLDLDNFKRLNDTLGHQAGDEALIHLVRVVKETLRPTDILARYGGEEFVVIFPDTDPREAARVMARLQRELTKRFFLHNNKRVLITFSAGVAMRAPGESREPLIARADRAVYLAKEAGRNRVVCAED